MAKSLDRHATALHRALKGPALGLIEALERAVDAESLRQLHPAKLLAHHDVAAGERFALAFCAAVRSLTSVEGHRARIDGMIANARKDAGRSALALSGGGTLGNYHIGVIRALMDHALLPIIVSGSSAGALIAAIVCSHDDAALRDLFGQNVHRLAADTEHVGLDSARLRSVVDSLIPDVTLAEAAVRSGRYVAIAVAHAVPASGGRVLDPVSTPDVLLRDAVMASCAIPFLFEPVQIGTRDVAGRTALFEDGASWIDGSIYADLPIAALAEVFGVDRVVASMVNPIVLPFLTDPHDHGALLHGAAQTALWGVRAWTRIGMAFALPVAEMFPPAHRALQTWGRLVEQRYLADIMITPRRRFHDPRLIVGHVQHDALQLFIREGEAATLARLDLIRAAVAVERALERRP